MKHTYVSDKFDADDETTFLLPFIGFTCLSGVI